MPDMMGRGIEVPVSVEDGGTGATSTTDARASLGLGTIATQAANNVSISGGSVTGITDLAIADGGTGASTAAGARETLGVDHVALVASRMAVQAGSVGGNYIAMGFAAAAGVSRAGTALAYLGHRIYGRHAPAANTDGSLIGGYNTETVNLVARAESTSSWTVYHFFGFGAQLSTRGGVAISNANITDVAKLANNSIGVRLRPELSANLIAVTTDNGGSSSIADTGVTAAADTIYVAEVRWNGTNARVRVAVVDQITGEFGAWSSPVTLSSNLPSNTLGMAPAQNWWCVGTPGVAPVAFVGGAVFVPWAVV